MKRLKLGSFVLPRVDSVKAVGVKLSMQGAAAYAQDSKRFDEAKDLAFIMQSAHLPHEMRMYGLSAYCCPKALYGSPVLSYTKSQVYALRRQMVLCLQATQAI